MKVIFITYDQAFQEKIISLLDKHNCRGFTQWDSVKGRGSKTGDPHYGTHAWPSMCAAIMTVVPEERVSVLLNSLHALDKETEQLGLRAFVWNVEQTI